jgi:hypothetical protein
LREIALFTFLNEPNRPNTGGLANERNISQQTNTKPTKAQTRTNTFFSHKDSRMKATRDLSIVLCLLHGCKAWWAPAGLRGAAVLGVLGGEQF